MDYLTNRMEMVAERILENERLTADLDDEAAQVLLDWGLSCAKLVVDSTVDIQDEQEAQEAMFTRLQANSLLMRSVNRWVPKRQTIDEVASWQEFAKVSQYAATVYAETFTTPTEVEWQGFLSSSQTSSDVEMMANLRNLFEGAPQSLPDDEPLDTTQPTTEETPHSQVSKDEPLDTNEPSEDGSLKNDDLSEKAPTNNKSA